MRHTPELNSARWRKSTYSNPNGGSCVEVADDFPGLVPVRDSKDPHGPSLLIPDAAWSTFVESLKNQS
ncbi:DUF397 domain-containing protein [Streptomyces decoyicus]|uniref:DUF397 domain-containing protein n=1 Tax=Streptomyces decoyicus TaxID=249567 RepID=UPI002E189554|nr:DUF397 domain-containing protein [Streptomyces decoyicus]